MSTGIIKAADALTEYLQNSIDLTGNIVITVSREYEVTYDMGAFEGRHIDVFPISYSGDDETRCSEISLFEIGIVILERYRPKGALPKLWVDTLVQYVENEIFNRLNDNELVIATSANLGNTSKFRVSDVSVTSVYDFDILKQNRVFWSELSVSLTRLSGD